MLQTMIQLVDEIVVIYLNDDQVSRPAAPPIVSPCKGIMSCFSFLFLGVTRHYVRRPYRCWWMECSRVRGRGHGSKSCGANLVVEGCTRTKQTFWTEDQFVVTASSGIRDHDTRVVEIVVREIQKTKPGKWGCVQPRKLWSSKEETHVCPGHHWLLKFGKVAGSDSRVEKEFILGARKFEEYKGCRFYNGDCALVVDV